MDGNEEDTSGQKRYIVTMQFRGSTTEQFVRKLRACGAPIQVILTLRKLRSCLPSLKAPVEKLMKSDVVYKITCSRCKTCYVGKISRHLATHGSQLRTMLDPLKMFPLEIKVNNKIYTTTVEACNVYLHNAKQVTMDSMTLVRDSNLEYSALRVQFNLPIVWTSGYYYL